MSVPRSPLQSDDFCRLTTSLNNSMELILRPDHQSCHRTRCLNFKDPNDDDETEENMNDENCFRKFTKGFFQRKILYRRIPIFFWLPRYSGEDAIGDLIAGITLAFAVIPLALAFANIARLPIEAGLYSSFAGNFIYTIFGSCKDNVLGSTAIASLLTYHVTKGVWQKAILFTFLSGFVEMVFLGLLRFSFVIDFVSGPVTMGFTSAIALIIFTSQIKDILVVKSTGSSFLQNWISMFGDIRNYRLNDTLLGVACVIILLVLRFIGNIRVKHLMNETVTRIVNKFLWLCGISRNSLVLFVCAGIVAYLDSIGRNYFILVGHIPSGFPEVQLPQFSVAGVAGNETAGLNPIPEESFFDIVEDFGSNLIVIPLIALLETIAICKTFAKGKAIDTTQEVISIGLANMLNAFFQGYRINGGLARSSINLASGGRTPMVNLYVCAAVILALIYFAKYFYYIPQAVLAAIIISAVIFQLQYQVIVPMWKSKKSDLLPYFVAFISCLVLPLTMGVALAIGVNLLFILYHSARPNITVESLETPASAKFLKLTPDRSLIFPAAEYVRRFVRSSSIKYALPVVFDCTHIQTADFTAAKVMSSMLEDFKKRQQKIIFYNLKPSVANVFRGVNMNMILCYDVESLEIALRGYSYDSIPTIFICNEFTKL